MNITGRPCLADKTAACPVPSRLFNRVAWPGVWCCHWSLLVAGLCPACGEAAMPVGLYKLKRFVERVDGERRQADAAECEVGDGRRRARARGDLLQGSLSTSFRPVKGAPLTNCIVVPTPASCPLDWGSALRHVETMTNTLGASQPVAFGRNETTSSIWHLHLNPYQIEHLKFLGKQAYKDKPILFLRSCPHGTPPRHVDWVRYVFPLILRKLE